MGGISGNGGTARASHPLRLCRKGKFARQVGRPGRMGRLLPVKLKLHPAVEFFGPPRVRV